MTDMKAKCCSLARKACLGRQRIKFGGLMSHTNPSHFPVITPIRSVYFTTLIFEPLRICTDGVIPQPAMTPGERDFVLLVLANGAITSQLKCPD